MPSCAGVGPSSGSLKCVLSAENPPTWEMLHPSEMKGLVLPSTTVQRSSRLPRFSAVFWYAVGPFSASCEPPKDDWPGLVSDRNYVQCTTRDMQRNRSMMKVPGMFCRHGSGTHANIKPTESTSAPPPMARSDIRGFAIACSCHFTNRPRPPTGWAWQCFGNPPRDRPRHGVSRLRSQRDTWLSAKQPKRPACFTNTLGYGSTPFRQCDRWGEICTSTVITGRG
jgi:hypothetical protein